MIETQSMLLQQLCWLYINSENNYKRSSYFKKIYNTYKHVFAMNTDVVCVSYVKDFVDHVFNYGDKEQIQQIIMMILDCKRINKNYMSNKFVSYIIDNITDDYEELFNNITKLKIKRS